MRYLALALLVWSAPLAAQQPRRQVLEAQIVGRFLENYRQQAGLTSEQYDRLRGVAQRSFTARRESQIKERQLWLALEGQMRPGVAANPDSVSRLLDAIVLQRQASVDRLKADDKEYTSFLSPVQRAQLYLATERLQRNVDDLLRRRTQPGVPPMGQPPDQR